MRPHKQEPLEELFSTKLLAARRQYMSLYGNTPEAARLWDIANAQILVTLRALGFNSAIDVHRAARKWGRFE